MIAAITSSCVAVSAKITAAKEKGIKFTLAIIVVGDDPASHVFKDRLVKLVESLGGEAKVLAMPETATQEEVIAAIKKLNHNRYVTGILQFLIVMVKPLGRPSNVGSSENEYWVLAIQIGRLP